MKVKLFSITTVVALLVLAVIPGSALAGAYATAFTTSITYQNVGTSATTSLQINFYANESTTTPITITRPNLAAGAGTSVYIGSVSEVSSGFQGTAVMSADQPLLATLVQVPDTSQTIVNNRPLSNGFSSGNSSALIASVLKNKFDSTTRFSVQNVGASTTTVTIKFYDTSANKVHEISQAITSGAGFYVDAGTISQLGSVFNGSVVVESSSGDIIASAMELGVIGVGAKAFEGVGSGATKFYMPSALCDAFGGQRTAYAVQNTSLATSTDVTVTYSNGVTEMKTVGPGAKQSFIACDATGMPAGFSGAATVESSSTPVVAIGKAYVAGSGFSTAFSGVSSGSPKLALPYVRWATDADYNSGSGQRVFITIQNIGSSGLAAGDVTVKYIDRDGAVSGTHTLPAIAVGAKTNSTASDALLTEFGYYHPGFGGGVIVEGAAGSELAVVARVATKDATDPFGMVAEDYNGMPTP